jgi:hypothetical protein
MHPLLARRLPSPTRGDARHMRIVVAIATLRLHDHNGAALEGFAADLAQERIQALDTAWHARTAQHVGVLRKRGPSYLRYGQDNRAIEHPCMQHLADLRDPILTRDFGPSQAQR